MSQLLPDVSLEEEESRGAEEDSAPTDAPAGENGGSEPKDANAPETSAQRTTELQNSSDRDRQRSTTKEDKNYSSVEEQFSGDSRKEGSENRQPSATHRASSASTKPDSERRAPASPGLTLVPDNRPDLSQKLGPYVSSDVDEALEDVYLLLRRRFGAKASKSLVVEVALRYILRDCLDREEESELMRWFDRVLDT
jgi:hypothetical protein